MNVAAVTDLCELPDLLARYATDIAFTDVLSEAMDEVGSDIVARYPVSRDNYAQLICGDIDDAASKRSAGLTRESLDAAATALLRQPVHWLAPALGAKL